LPDQAAPESSELQKEVDGPAVELDVAQTLANGRTLPKLLFATDIAKLQAKLGPDVDEALDHIRNAGQALHDVAGSATPWADVSKAAVGHKGVVVIGDYDIMPSKRFDYLPSAVRRAAAAAGHKDPDDWIVWSDHEYADTDGDGLQDLPISRIPDGNSVPLLKRALTAGRATASSRFGLRNVMRPFADVVFREVGGSEGMLLSEPTETGHVTGAQINTANIYLMLHGNSADCARFWGEKSCGSGLEAINTGTIPQLDGSVVFAGCCYGALLSKEAAVVAGGPTPLSVGESMAIEFLNKGALAFAGTTGAHYSPTGTDTVGSPTLHIDFWKRVAAGSSPAEALFQAKIDYLTNLPYHPDPTIYAILLKPWGQFTCLGLGW
jgi:hypothetical protein